MGNQSSSQTCPKKQLIKDSLSVFGFKLKDIEDPVIFNEDSVKKRFKLAALQAHPDRNGGSGARWDTLSMHYDILKGLLEQLSACKYKKTSEEAIRAAVNASLQEEKKRQDAIHFNMKKYAISVENATGRAISKNAEKKRQTLITFMGIVDAKEDISTQYLRAANWDVQKAMDAYLIEHNNTHPKEGVEKEEKKMEPNLKGDERLSGPLRQLKKFLIDIGLEDYFESFRKNDCDISYIEDFDDATLETVIGMKSILKRRKFLREAGVFKNEMDEFSNVLIQRKVSPLISKKLKKHGILTVHILCNEIKCKRDLKNVLQILNDLQCEALWNIIQSQMNPLVVDENSGSDYQAEGVQNVNHVERDTVTPYI
eukprot:194007_1